MSALASCVKLYCFLTDFSVRPQLRRLSKLALFNADSANINDI